MNALFQFLDHLFMAYKTGITVGLAAFGVAFISAWPELIPKTAQEWWTWLRTASQSAMPIHRLLPAPQVQQQPQQPVATPNTIVVAPIAERSKILSDTLAQFSKKK